MTQLLLRYIYILYLCKLHLYRAVRLAEDLFMCTLLKPIKWVFHVSNVLKVNLAALF